MQVQLHQNARTTPAVHVELCASTLPNRTLARQYRICEATVAKWREPESAAHGSHRRKRLRATLSPAQEAIVAELRKTFSAAAPRR